jgi:hypothetical protein
LRDRRRATGRVGRFPGPCFRRRETAGAVTAGVGLVWAPAAKAIAMFLVSPLGVAINWIATIHALIF